MARQYPEGVLLTFSKQDLVTFLVGLAAACAITFGEALVMLETTPIEDLGLWARNLGVGLAGAAGRYLVTELTQRGLRYSEPEPDEDEDIERESMRDLLSEQRIASWVEREAEV